MSNRYILTSILVMAVVTYLIRMLPMAIFRKKIKNRFTNGVFGIRISRTSKTPSFKDTD